MFKKLSITILSLFLLVGCSGNKDKSIAEELLNNYKNDIYESKNISYQSDMSIDLEMESNGETAYIITRTVTDYKRCENVSYSLSKTSQNILGESKKLYKEVYTSENEDGYMVYQNDGNGWYKQKLENDNSDNLLVSLGLFKNVNLKETTETEYILEAEIPSELLQNFASPFSNSNLDFSNLTNLDGQHIDVELFFNKENKKLTSIKIDLGDSFENLFNKYLESYSPVADASLKINECKLEVKDINFDNNEYEIQIPEDVLNSRNYEEFSSFITGLLYENDFFEINSPETWSQSTISPSLILDVNTVDSETKKAIQIMSSPTDNEHNVLEILKESILNEYEDEMNVVSSEIEISGQKLPIISVTPESGKNMSIVLIPEQDEIYILTLYSISADDAFVPEEYLQSILKIK